MASNGHKRLLCTYIRAWIAQDQDFKSAADLGRYGLLSLVIACPLHVVDT